MTIKGIVSKKGALKSFYPNKHKKSESSEKVYSLIITLYAKETEIEVYLNKGVAVEINNQININNAVIIENVKLKRSKDRLKCYTSDYSSFKYKSVKSIKFPKVVKKLYFQLESTDLKSLRTNHMKIGKAVLFMTPPIEKETKNGTRYQLAMSDGTTNGILQTNEEQKNAMKFLITDRGTYEVEGIYHTKYDNYKIEPDRFNIKNSENELTPECINLHVKKIENSLVCLKGQVIDVYLPEEFVHNDKKKDTIHEVRFSCSEVTIRLSALYKEERKIRKARTI